MTTRATTRASAWTRGLPWTDAAGRLSALKLAVFILLLVPATIIAVDIARGTLGPRPVEAAIHEAGTWALRLLLLALAVSSLRRTWQWPRLASLRRLVGVAAFAYALAHLCLYIVDQRFDLALVATEIALRLYLAIGFAVLLMLSALAATSTDGMARYLGGKRWRRLHRLVYGAALLAVVHFFMQTKFDVAEPWVMAGLFGWLMGERIAAARGWPADGMAPWRATILALVAATGTALGEAFYYWLAVGISPLRVLVADLTLDAGLRPAWVVLAITLAVAGIGARRRLFMPRVLRQQQA